MPLSGHISAGARNTFSAFRKIVVCGRCGIGRSKEAGQQTAPRLASMSRESRILGVGMRIHFGVLTVRGRGWQYAALAGILGWLLPASLPSAEIVDVPKLLAGIENRYNHIHTLEVAFSETWTLNGRKRTGNGTLMLRKPGRMRWEYAMPAGRLFISDGEFIYSYSPEENRAEKIKMKSVDDMRAPLAFLLGRLNFHDEFSEFRASPQGDQVLLTALPKSGKMPYSEVSFLSGADYVIHRLIVKQQDNSVLEYDFEGEKTNLPVSDSEFHFTPPPGVEFVDSSRQ